MLSVASKHTNARRESEVVPQKGQNIDVENWRFLTGETVELGSGAQAVEEKTECV